MKKEQCLIYTPIAKTFKYKSINNDKKTSPDSRRDFFEQKERFNKNKQAWMWDSDDKNMAKEEDIFAFTHYNDHVQFHKILSVLNPINRLPSWQCNVGHGHRNVLILSDPIYIMPWSEWLDYGGAKRIMGTQIARKDISKILDLINKIESKMQ